MEKKKLSEIQVEDIMNRKWIPYVIFAACTLFIHIFGYELYGDDVSVFEGLRDKPIDEFKAAFDITKGWSSRIFINPFIHFMMHFDYKVWLVLDVMIFVGMFCYIKKYAVFGDKVSYLYIIMSLMNIISYLDFSEVGWTVVTMTYIWVAGTAMIVLQTVVRSYKGEKISIAFCVLSILLTVYAANKEEMSIMLTIIFAVSLVLNVKEKKRWLLILVQWLVSFVSLLFHVTSPGNNNRYEVKFATQAVKNTFIEKVIIGISTTIRRIFFQHSFVFLCFVVVLVLVVWFSCKYVVPRVASLIPLILWFMTWVPGKIDYMFGTNTYSGPRIWATIILGVIGVLSIFVCLYYLYVKEGNGIRFIVMVTLLVAGFAGRCATGFANSGWQAYERTYTFLYIVFVAVAVMLACDCWGKLSYRKKQILFGTIIVIGQLGFFKNILDVGII